MCIDGDNSGHATQFVNAQLEALYSIAGTCVEHYAEQGIDRSTQTGYDFALREYYYKSGSSAIKFEFGKPEVEFVCNHDAILYLTIKSVTVPTTFEALEPRRSGGTFVPGAHGGEVSSTKDYVPESRSLSRFKGQVSVRVPFHKYRLSGKSDAIGDREHALHSFILGLSKGYFVQAGTLEATAVQRPYLEAYLLHLAKAGHHVIYSLPDFDDDAQERAIDFSAATTANYDHVTKAFSFELTEIINHVQDVWLKAAWLAHKVQQEGKGDLAIRNTIAVAKWEHHWRPSNAPFDIEFGAPTVQLLCEREAILIFSLENIVYHAGAKGTREFHNWKIAIIVDILADTLEGESITIIRINSKKAKFAEHLSDFGDEDFSDDVNWQLYQLLITFISLEYLQFLEIGGFYLFYRDLRIPRHIHSGKKDIWVGEIVEDSDYITGITGSTEMYGFQQIIALSHTSLDNIFASYYKEREWMQFSTWGGVEIKFGVPRVRLLSNNRALVFIHLESGVLQMTSEKDKHTFENWTLAFEVTIGMRKVDLKSRREIREFRQTKAYEDSKDWKDTYLQQLYIDFDNAQFNYQLSEFKDPNFGKNNLAIRKVIAMNQYLEKNFLGQIKDASADILYSIVISKDMSDTRPRYAFSDVTFQIYSSCEITHHNYNIVSPHEEPIIVILGMTDPKRLLPYKSLRYSGYWMLRPGYSLGTLALSSEVFLKGRLLPLLANINRATTLVPVNLDMDKGHWNISLASWSAKYAKDGDVRIHSTEWELIQNKSPHAFEYKWDHSDEYEYIHEGAQNDVGTGTYYLGMKTDNYLTIPKSFRAGQLDIIVKGTSNLTLGWSNVENKARHKAYVSWTIIISLVTKPGGLSIEIAKQFEPQYELKTEGFIPAEEADRIDDPKSLMESTFPRAVALEAELKSLKKFETVWYSLYPGLKAYRLANPFFTERGDLFLELHEYDQITQPSEVPTLGSRATGRPVLTRPRSKFGSGPSSPRTPGRTPTSPFGIEPSPATPTFTTAIRTTAPAPAPSSAGVGGSAPKSAPGPAPGAAKTAPLPANGAAANGNGATPANVKAT